jgi:hypothetical protein
MQKETNPHDFDSLKKFVTSIFDTIPSKLVVSESLHQKEIALLQESLGSSRFFFVVDLVNFEITEKHGIERWLGYGQNEFNLKKYWNIVHPGKQMALMAIAVQLYNSVCRGKYKLEYLVQRYGSQIALKHYNGKYLLFQKISSVFQYDEHNRLTHYMNEFIRIGEYENEPLRPFFFTSSGDEEKERGGEVLQNAIEQFIGMKVFSPKELQVARLLAYNPTLKQGEIAISFKVSTHTIDTYCKRFLNKSREYFHYNFSTVIEAATHLRKEGLV